MIHYNCPRDHRDLTYAWDDCKACLNDCWLTGFPIERHIESHRRAGLSIYKDSNISELESQVFSGDAAEIYEKKQVPTSLVRETMFVRTGLVCRLRVTSVETLMACYFNYGMSFLFSQACLPGLNNRRRPISHLQFSEDAGDLIADGFFRDDQFFRDLGVARPAGD